MSKRVFNDYHPEIVGLDWAPGNLILVASRSWGGKNQYVLGNCIVAGTMLTFISASFKTSSGIIVCLLSM